MFRIYTFKKTREVEEKATDALLLLWRLSEEKQSVGSSKD